MMYLIGQNSIKINKLKSLVDLMCKYHNCVSKSTYPTSEPISFDYGHLTGSGSILVSSLIIQAMDENNNQL